MHDNSDWSKSLRVEVRGDDVVGHAGNVIPRMLADATGLTEALSAAVSRPEVTHDRGAVWRDVAVAITGGAENLAPGPRCCGIRRDCSGRSRRSRRCGGR